jgi:hypothetical protein
MHSPPGHFHPAISHLRIFQGLFQIDGGPQHPPDAGFWRIELLQWAKTGVLS